MHETPRSPGDHRSKSPILRQKSGVVEYYGYRDYDATSGRWTGRDPLGDSAFRMLKAQDHKSFQLGKDFSSDSIQNKQEIYDESINLSANFMPSIELNLYRFSLNSPVYIFDYMGLLEYSVVAENYPLESKYPTDITKDSSIWNFIGGKVLENAQSGVFENSCAIRLSHALNASGLKIKYDRGKTSSGKPEPERWWYYVRVVDLRRFITSKLGKPKVFKSEEFKNNCKKGIVIMNITTWNDATGHADLWDGKSMIDGRNDYVMKSTSIDFWELD